MKRNPRLSVRQQEVLDLLAQGKATIQIANELFLSVATVRNHIQNMMVKFGAHSRLELIALARTDAEINIGDRVLAWCLGEGYRLTELQKILIGQAFAASYEIGCLGDAHLWPQQVPGQPWRCQCGAITAGVLI
jgi:DNA-binding CsgD family transcriptional regulator